GDDARHDAVRLQVAADEERLASGILETALDVKSNGPPVPLPPPAPQRRPAELSRRLYGRLHQRLRNTASVMRFVDIKPHDLDLAMRRRNTAQLRVSDQLRAGLALHEQRHHVCIFDLAQLLRLT